MDVINHFGHEHPLTFRQDEDEDYKPHLCSICELPILTSPSYACTVSTCDFFLHKPCAELPLELKYPFPPYPRSLFQLESSPRYDSNCLKCNKSCHNFTYCYEYSNGDLHPLCATSMEIKIKHKSHLKHPLVANYKEISCNCDACGENHEGFFFSCQECNFWIHKDCTLLPSIVKHVSHSHPFVLTYVLSDLYEDSFPLCTFCKRMFIGNGAFFCGECQSAAHPKCAMSNMENHTSELVKQFVHLPSEWDRFPCSIGCNVERETITADMDDDRKSTVQKYHTNHPLIFHNSSSSSSSVSVQEVLCNACTRPIISSPFWKCDQPYCNFLLHDFCANLPPKTYYQGWEAQFSLLPDTSNYYFYSIFFCHFCGRPCNGFAYCFDEDPGSRFLCDVECTLAPKTATHTSHGRHILFLSSVQDNIPFSCCSHRSICNLAYRCVTCDFQIHLGCALLPKMVRHKFDKHPLELVFNDWVEIDCCFCEFCEEDIDQRYWFYHCADCDQSFHVKCIPSVGLLSKIKFGGTLNVSCHPRHPVVLTRMIMESNQRCGFCKEIIKGFVDDMAFHCEECYFWIHFSCASKCIDRTHGSCALWYDIATIWSMQT